MASQSFPILSFDNVYPYVNHDITSPLYLSFIVFLILSNLAFPTTPSPFITFLFNIFICSHHFGNWLLFSAKADNIICDEDCSVVLVLQPYSIINIFKYLVTIYVGFDELEIIDNFEDIVIFFPACSNYNLNLVAFLLPNCFSSVSC